MKSILISIKPEWVEKILNGEKTIEIRKTRPKCELPCKVYIYCSKSKNKYLNRKDGWLCFTEDRDILGISGNIRKYTNNVDGVYERLNGLVVAEFTLNKIDKIEICDPYIFRNNEQEDWEYFEKNACLICEQMMEYIGYGEDHDGWDKKYDIGYAWHMDDLIIYEKPKELSQFYSTKKCKPVNNSYGENQTWEQRHKRCIASSHGIPIECFGCKNLIQHKDYLDEASGVMLFDYSCKTNYHKPLSRPPQSWCYVEEV